MSSRREVPPDLPGFTYVSLLGQGGYADVFLYEQHMPRRRVAVKVLLPEAISGSSSAQFAEEANTMAAVSDHPYIVTIYQAGVAGDGRAYLVMEYYPNPNFSVRARNELIPLAEVLKVGVQVASAVETAHRAGILHRDIKPANVLTSALLRPGLTDFGISVQGGSVTVAEGLSIPWAPPEIVSGGAQGDRRSDVYSLGATLYTMLIARSPFEVPGGSNRAADLIGRIERSLVPGTGRADVPASLERLLQQSMAKDPAARPQTAAAFARSLQAIEQEFGPGFTALDVLDETVVARRPTIDASDDGGATKLKGPVRIDAQAPIIDDRTAHRGHESLIAAIPDQPTNLVPPQVRPRVGMPQEPELDKTFVPRAQGGIAEDATPARPRRTGVLVGSVVALLAVGGGVAVLALKGGASEGTAVTTVPAAPVQTLLKHVEIDPVSALKAVRSGTDIALTWTAPVGAKDLKYEWHRSDPGSSNERHVTAETSVAVSGVAVGTPACFDVASVDSAGRLSDPQSTCVS